MDEPGRDVVKEESCQLLVASFGDRHLHWQLATNNWQLNLNDNPVILALDEQVTCYRRLAKLAEQQHEHVQKSHTEALLEVLKSRQLILDQLAKLELIVGPAKRRWAEFIGEIEVGLREKAEVMVAETRRLLEQIMSSDRRDALSLQQQKLNLGKQIHKAASAKQINRTYATAAYGQRTSRMDIQQ